MGSQTAILLPRPTRLRASGIALYNEGGEIDFDLAADFFAIVGANGLGKSTLLNLLLYAITGAVRRAGGNLDVDKSTRGALAVSVEHAITYFEGRVRRTKQSPAWVEVTYELGNHVVVVRRQFFVADSTIYFAIDNKNRTPKNPEDIESRYREAICDLAHVVSFEQFAFFVFTVQYFGEDHFCLFWDQIALNQIIATVIGEDATVGEKLADLFQEFKKHDSLVRNLQWQITNEQKVFQKMSANASGKAVSKSTLDKYENTLNRVEQLRTRLATLAEEQSSASAARDEAQLEVDDVRRKLEAETWAALSRRRIPIARSPVYLQLTSELICPVCRTQHKSIPDAVTKAIDLEKCPLCAANVSARGGTTVVDEKLKELASARRKTEATLAKRQDELESHLASYADCREELRREEASLQKLEAGYQREVLEAALRLRQQELSGEPLTNQELKIAGLTKEKEEHKAKRDTAAKKLAKQQDALLEGFHRVRGDLVPRFQKLAREFLGLPLSLSARTKKQEQIPIVDFHISLSGSERRRPEQLSESQRFFLDIALRMTLLSWIAQNRWKPFLAIDTPEGALDIAYETNAGTMFGVFLTEHDGVLLTASNLNSSQLIRKTIELCRDAKSSISLLDLRDYAHVTEVQRDHKPLMDTQITELRALSTPTA